MLLFSAVGEYRLTASQQEAKNSVFRESHSKQPQQIRKCISNNDHLETLRRVQVMGWMMMSDDEQVKAGTSGMVSRSLRLYLITQ